MTFRHLKDNLTQVILKKTIMKKILIIEDEKDMVTGLQFNLEARDYAVIAAYDGEAGYQKALSEHPDLVILDLMLPKLNGYEVCKRLKKEILVL